MKVQFQFENPERVAADLSAILRRRGESFRRVPAAAIRRGIFELLALIQELAPKKTSTLVRSISAVVKKISEDIVEGRVGSHLEYARYIEEGTGLHGPKGRAITIQAKGRKGLFWGAFDGGGKALIRKRVVSPGMKPRAPFATAIAKFLPRYDQIIREELAKATA